MPLTISTKSLTETLTSWGMIILFPGFFLYHLLLSMGFMPPFLCGLFGPVSMIYFIIYLILFPLTYRKTLNASPVLYIFSLTFFIYCMFWILVHYFTVYEPYIQIACIQALAALLISITLFFIGIHFSFENKTIKAFFILSFVAIFIGLMCFTLISGNVMFYPAEIYALEDYHSVASYQGFARSALVITVLLFCYSKNLFMQVLIMMAGLFILFVLGARSEFYSFLFLLIIFLTVYSIKNVKWLFLAISTIVIVYFVILFNFEWLSSSRQIQIIDLSHSTSMIERQYQHNIAVKQIIDNPVLGCFGGHILDTGDEGSYAHNALSAWAAYGIIGFIFYVVLIMFTTFHSFFYFMKYRAISAHWAFAFAINILCLFLIVVSKSVFWILPYLGWGLYFNAMVKHKSRSKSSCI